MVRRRALRVSTGFQLSPNFGRVRGDKKAYRQTTTAATATTTATAAATNNSKNPYARPPLHTPAPPAPRTTNSRSTLSCRVGVKLTAWARCSGDHVLVAFVTQPASPPSSCTRNTLQPDDVCGYMRTYWPIEVVIWALYACGNGYGLKK